MKLKSIHYRCGMLLLLAAMVLAEPAFAQKKERGFYKDVWMDGGVRLTSKKDLPVVRYLGLEMENLLSAATKDLSARDTLAQSRVVVGSEMDENGHLLYPDGAPRFRMLYLNGGLATQHGRSLGESGRERIREFIRNGGSYLGSCAGAFITGIYCDTVENEIRKDYLHIWPGYCITTGMTDTYTGIFVPEDSPLLNYYDFGGDLYIDSVYHNGGCYAAIENGALPEGTVVLTRYDADTMKLKKPAHKRIASWAYKASENSGRVVAVGSHPESSVYGEKLDYMASMVKYAIDGNRAPQLKAELEKGVSRKMIHGSSAGKPEYAKIGDKQYHHYTIEVPEGVETLTVHLESIPGMKNFDLYALANSGGFAWLDSAQYRNIKLGVDKTLFVNRPKAGKLYISVFCATTVDTKQTFWGTEYCGRTDVLNGVPYIITVDYK
ncbi:MAG: hypothetical protein KBS89_04680 [Bacteroidales bacterium]|nr:hypothetical protein [Candidatus Egerieousia equi]